MALSSRDKTVLVVFLLVGVAVLAIVVALCVTSKRNNSSSSNNPRAGLGLGAPIVPMTTPPTCNPTADGIVTDAPAWQPAGLKMIPISNTPDSYRLVSFGVSRPAGNQPVATVAFHAADGSIVPSPTGFDGVFQQCPDTNVNGPCTFYDMSVKGVLWNPKLLTGTSTPVGLVAYGPQADGGVTAVLPKLKRGGVTLQTACQDTSNNWFGGHQGQHPWVFGSLHASGPESGTSVETQGVAANGTQMMVGFPADADWMANTTLRDNWGIVGVGIDRTQPDCSDCEWSPKSTGRLRADVYHYEETKNWGTSPVTTTVEYHAVSSVSLPQFGDDANVLDVRVENGAIWVVVGTNGHLGAAIARLVIPGGSTAGVTKSSTIELDTTFGGGKGYVTLPAGATYVDMLTQYVPVPKTNTFKDVTAVTAPQTFEAAGVALYNRVCVVKAVVGAGVATYGLTWDGTLTVLTTRPAAGTTPLSLVTGGGAMGWNPPLAKDGDMVNVGSSIGIPERYAYPSRVDPQTGFHPGLNVLTVASSSSKEAVLETPLSGSSATGAPNAVVASLGTSANPVTRFTSPLVTPPYWMAPLSPKAVTQPLTSPYMAQPVLRSVLSPSGTATPTSIRATTDATWGYAVMNGQVQKISGAVDGASGVSPGVVGFAPTPATLPVATATHLGTNPSVASLTAIDPALPDVVAASNLHMVTPKLDLWMVK